MRKRLLGMAIYGFCLFAQDAVAESVPRIVGPWRQIAGNPELGELTSEKQQPVDFGIWQAADGSWQLWSCIRNTKEAGRGRVFHRWESKNLNDANWRPMGIAMRARPELGETAGGLQAPFVVRENDLYYMFYGDYENICLATSKDGKQFDRRIRDGSGARIFTEGIGNRTRDPMLLKIDGLWHCYYCAMEGRGGMFVRTSKSLLNWGNSKPKMILTGGEPGEKWFHAECPQVVPHQTADGSTEFFLFRTSNYRTQKTTVYRSLNPTAFGINDDSKIVATLEIAAPEVVRYNGEYWLAALNPGLDGIRLAKLKFETISVR